MKGWSEKDRDSMMEVLEKAVMPVARKLRQNVHFVHVMHARSWSSSRRVEL
jgi:hypothetical protein